MHLLGITFQNTDFTTYFNNILWVWQTKKKWSIDKIHSEISFSVKHLMILPVKGLFNTFDASSYSSNKFFLQMLR